jgi:hypothetical protein
MTSANEKNGIRTKCDNLLDVFHNVQTWDDRHDLRQEHIPPLEVPDFQRPYEWPAHMVISFTAKLFETYKLQDTDDTSTSTHFASTVFLHLDKNPSKHCPLNNRWRALILDGQQRLITLTLILLVLKDRLSQFHSQIKRKNSSSPSAADDEFYEQMDEMIGKLNTRIFCKPSSRISVPRLTAHPDQHEVSFYANVFQFLCHFLTPPILYLILSHGAVSLNKMVLRSVWHGSMNLKNFQLRFSSTIIRLYPKLWTPSSKSMCLQVASRHERKQMPRRNKK